MRHLPISIAALAAVGCAPAPQPAAQAAPQPAVQSAPQPAVQSAPASPPALASACAAPENRQFDFWLGDWQLVVRVRKAAGSEEWAEAKATNRIRASLGGCVIEESFAAEGPQQPWAGRSVSVYQPQEKRWRQTWVDDQGSYLAFTGALENGRMTLTGEPRQKDGKTISMRMVFAEITPRSLLWTWERTADGGASWTAMMVITYARKADR